ncbi:NXPE family member 2-like [Mercenaria mercenaria]|uniref:NXPE family member 2-like n=1 Tax=Mercenaria mercenaria TaxID=6596 RepID=UPI00234F2E70|nr:NXPE family member 2-like [Mercenaria mercenaria]
MPVISKITGVVILTTLLVITLMLMFDVPVSRVHSIIFAQSETTISYAPKDIGIGDPHDPRFHNIILEEEALMFEPCRDVNKTASVQHSKLSLTDHINSTYNIGETIRIVATLYDGYGKRKYSGGDHLRATIENKDLKASAPCVVTDNRNGTHFVACEALWSGVSAINISLAYARETITSIYRIRTQVCMQSSFLN